MSTSEIRALIREMPPVLRAEMPCRNKQASLAVATYRDLNQVYLHRMFGAFNVSGNVLMSLWSLRVFHDRSYSRFMSGVVDALRQSFRSGKPIKPFSRKVTENLVLHNEAQLRFPVEALKGIYEDPSAEDVTRAFEEVKAAIGLHANVDKTSKQLVLQAVKFDIRSLNYMFKIENAGPLLQKVGDRVFRLYEDTLAIVKALPAK